MVEITDDEFNELRDYIKTTFGISLSDEKKPLVNSRLRAILDSLNLTNFSDFTKALKKDKSGELTVRFINKMTTNHTFFMRETEHFEYLEKVVFPQIFDSCKTKDLRLWCAACSSGEEAYTLEIMADEYFNTRSEGWDTRIIATDLSTNVLAKAHTGIYKTESLQEMPPRWVKRYFKKLDSDSSQVIESIRKKIIFRKLNLMDDEFPVSVPLQVIFCRNVMIYFDNETRDKLVEKFYDYLEPGGYLFVGHSESLSQGKTRFKYIMPAVYRKM